MSDANREEGSDPQNSGGTISGLKKPSRGPWVRKPRLGENERVEEEKQKKSRGTRANSGGKRKLWRE